MEENTNVVNTSATEKEGSKFGWGVLGFFIPLVGLILFLVWMKDKKKAAKAAGIGALIGFIFSIISTVLLITFFGAILGIGLFEYDNYNDNYNPAPIVEEEKCDDLENCYPDFSKMTSSEASLYLDITSSKKVELNDGKSVYLKLYTTDCGNKENGSVASLVRRDGTKYTKADGTKKLDSDSVDKMYFAICKNLDDGKTTDVSNMKTLNNLEKIDVTPQKLEQITSNTDLLYKDYGLSVVINGENVDVIVKPGQSNPSTKSFSSIKSVYGYVKYSRTALYLVTNDNDIYAYNIYWSADIQGNMGIKAKQYEFDKEIDSLYYYEQSKDDPVDYMVLVHTSDNKYYNFENVEFDPSKSYAKIDDSNAYILTDGGFKFGDKKGKLKAYLTYAAEDGNVSHLIDTNNKYYSIESCIDCFLSNFSGVVDEKATISKIIEVPSTNLNNFSKVEYYLQIEGTEYYIMLNSTYLHKGVKNGQ